jgi:hypothetical protein
VYEQRDIEYLVKLREESRAQATLARSRSDGDIAESLQTRNSHSHTHIHNHSNSSSGNLGASSTVKSVRSRHHSTESLVHRRRSPLSEAAVDSSATTTAIITPFSSLPRRTNIGKAEEVELE